MKTTIIISPFTVPVELAKAFALHKGWQETLTRQKTVVDDATTDQVTTHFEDEQYLNPETLDMWITKFADNYIKSIFGDFPSTLVNQELANTGVVEQVQKAQSDAQALLDTTIKQIEDAVVAPILASLTTSVVTQ